MNVFRNLKSKPTFVGGLLAIAFIVVMLAFMGWQNWGITPTPTPTPRQASVVELRKDVSARETASADWLGASIGQEILVGGGVKTGEEARARVDISDGTVLRLGSITEFALAALSPEPANTTTKWSLVAGKVWLFVSESLGSGSFEVEMPSGVATVRGSYLGLEFVPATGQVVATCLEGLCRLTGSTGTFTDLTTGQQSEIAGAEQPPSPGHPMDADRLAEWAREYPEAGNIVTTITPAPTPTLVIPTPTATPTDYCSQAPNMYNSLNVYAHSFERTPTVVASGGSYWIRMSEGFENGGEAKARTDQPNVSLLVTMNDVILPMTGDTHVEYNTDARFWEVNSYHCTGVLAPGQYTIVGTSYHSSQYADSATFDLVAK